MMVYILGIETYDSERNEVGINAIGVYADKGKAEVIAENHNETSDDIFVVQEFGLIQ